MKTRYRFLIIVSILSLTLLIRVVIEYGSAIDMFYLKTDVIE